MEPTTHLHVPSFSLIFDRKLGHFCYLNSGVYLVDASQFEEREEIPEEATATLLYEYEFQTLYNADAMTSVSETYCLPKTSLPPLFPLSSYELLFSGATRLSRKRNEGWW